MRVSRLKLSVAAATENWSPKFVNADSVFTCIHPLESGGMRALLIVADGIGSKFTGKVSSQLATSVLHHSLRDIVEQDDSGRSRADFPPGLKAPEKYLEGRLRLAVTLTIKEIYNHWQQSNADKGASTLACVLVHGRWAIVAHVGDSRVYHLHRGKLQQMTEDHTLTSELVRLGKLSPQQAHLHPHRNVLTSLLGADAEVRAMGVLTQALEIDDQFLLCSDGLHGIVSEEEMEQCLLGAKSPDEAVKALVEAVKRVGIDDDVAVIVAKVEAD